MERAIDGKPGWTNDLIAISPKDPEWNCMFSAFTDTVMLNKECGEVLQYMGTVVERYQGKIQSIYHEFRHRAVPGTNQRKYWKIGATPDFVFRYMFRDQDMIKTAV